MLVGHNPSVALVSSRDQQRRSGQGGFQLSSCRRARYGLLHGLSKSWEIGSSPLFGLMLRMGESFS
jgi:hypothetical protein